MKQVHARFSLIDDLRTTYYTRNNETRLNESCEAARVKFSAVQGEPFGNLTPSGTIEMLIVNPDAIEVFRNAKLGQEYDVVFTERETTQ